MVNNYSYTSLNMNHSDVTIIKNNIFLTLFRVANLKINKFPKFSNFFVGNIKTLNVKYILREVMSLRNDF